jgi:hypothetical protein
MNRELTFLEERVLNLIAAECDCSGFARGIFAVGVIAAGLDYKTSWRIINQLEMKAKINVRRSAGHASILETRLN